MRDSNSLLCVCVSGSPLGQYPANDASDSDEDAANERTPFVKRGRVYQQPDDDDELGKYLSLGFLVCINTCVSKC
jgi:hypothetical protein